MKKPVTIDDYLAAFPEETRKVLEQIRATIRQVAPDAQETISYGMPTFKMNGVPLAYFAAFSHHIGFYAAPTAHEAFRTDLSGYKTGKGSVQFPLGQPMPLELIIRMVQFNLRALTVKKPVS
jgi:uncharacterized protein YdhG (YjbR/CyaY superfamily)